MAALSGPCGDRTKTGCSGRRGSVPFHIRHRDHPDSALLVLGVPPLLLWFLQHAQDVPPAEGEVLIVVAREVKQCPDILGFLGLLGRSDSGGADEAWLPASVHRLYERCGVQVVDLVELQQSRQPIKLLIPNPKPRRSQSWWKKWDFISLLKNKKN